MRIRQRITALVLCMVLLLLPFALFTGCAQKANSFGYKVNPSLDTSKEVLLRIASSKETGRKWTT